MSIQPINIGQTANDGSGESLREGGAKINANFAELDQRTSTAQGSADAATAGLADKVDKVSGLGLSEASFTQQEKTKLAGLESPHFRGTFTDLAALVAGVTDAVPGDYADVDTAGADAVRFIWDATDSVWLAGGSADPITAAQVKSLYESNPDTNPFTDAEKAKLAASATTTDGLTEGATNKYWTGARTLGTALAGLVLDSAAVIAATDTVLSGLGKLQAQISAHVGKGGTGQHPVSSATTAGFMPAFPSLTDGKTYGFKNGVFTEVSSSGGSGAIFGEMRTLSSRSMVIAGVPYADGQLIEGADVLYPDAVANIQSSTPSVPVTTPVLWLSDPTMRACWAYDPVTKQLRVPDWNGKQAGSIGPLMFRPDGTLGFAPGKVRQDQTQGYRVEMAGYFVNDTRPIGGGIATSNSGNTRQGPDPVGNTIAWGSSTGTGNANGYPVFNSGRRMTDDVNGTPRTGTETFSTHGIGVWGVVLFGAVSNAGAADAAVLATSYANQQARIQALEAGAHTYVYPNGGTQAAPANVVNNSRYVSANPYGLAPVICLPQVFLGGAWETVFPTAFGSTTATYGVIAAPRGDNSQIVTQTGSAGVHSAARVGQFSTIETYPAIQTTLPCRVLVAKV
ncbi:hypothetical protein [Pseudomonas viridiflava]|uniref:hypothetical protein n=1 Tax=Pseudomonas viridiflava TaxID=33069 RepID=UPI000F053455|nr:hypothetical protein [Pseudomonas viridiflava]